MKALLTILIFVSMTSFAKIPVKNWSRVENSKNNDQNFNLFFHGQYFGARIYPGTGQNCWDKYGTGFCTPPVINAGDSIVYEAATSGYITLALINFRFPVTNPVVVFAEGTGGQVVMGAMAFQNCEGIKLDGLHVIGSSYGFKFRGDGTINFSPGIDITGRIKNIEVCGFEVYEMGYGVRAKTDFGCVDSLNYPNWVIRNISIHDYKLSLIYADALYLGNSNPDGDILGCGERHPMKLANFFVYNGIIQHVVRNGIQIAECDSAWIFNNLVEDLGHEIGNVIQGCGIAIGSASQNINVYSNTVKNTLLDGIICFGIRKNYVQNNTVDSSGYVKMEAFEILNEPYLNMDSLCAAIDGVIHSTNSIWGTLNYHIVHVGRYLINTYGQSTCYVLQPGNDSYGAIEGTTLIDSSTIVWRNNKAGLSVTIDNDIDRNIITSLTANKFVFKNVGKNPIGSSNYICGNTALDGVTPITPQTGGAIYISLCTKNLRKIRKGKIKFSFF